MANKMYAWSNIVWHDGNKNQTYKPGDVVDSSKFNEDDWDYFVREGVVREQPYPQGAANAGTSPTQHFTNLLNTAAEGTPLTSDQVQELTGSGQVVDVPTQSTPAPSATPAKAEDK